MYIVFHEQRRISEDGFSGKLCEPGRVYDILDATACWCIRNEWARNATDAETIEFVYDKKFLNEATEQMTEALNATL